MKPEVDEKATAAAEIAAEAKVTETEVASEETKTSIAEIEAGTLLAVADTTRTATEVHVGFIVR